MWNFPSEKERLIIPNVWGIVLQQICNHFQNISSNYLHSSLVPANNGITRGTTSIKGAFEITTSIFKIDTVVQWDNLILQNTRGTAKDFWRWDYRITMEEYKNSITGFMFMYKQGILQNKPLPALKRYEMSLTLNQNIIMCISLSALGSI